MQAYRYMDIGTAKPDASFRAKLPHHLVDILDPDEQYTVADFVRHADLACDDILLRGRIPVVSGGAGYYVRHFLYGMPTSPAADPDVRRLVARDLERSGPSMLRAELERVDPVSAGRIHENDLYRLTRAVEILRMTGKPLGAFASGASLRTDRAILLVGIDVDRSELDSRIDARVELMFERGLEAEVRSLVASGYGASCPGMRAIGYREFFTTKDSDEYRALVKSDTRKYARRQMTFFRSMPTLAWIPPDPGILAELIERFLADSSSAGPDR